MPAETPQIDLSSHPSSFSGDRSNGSMDCGSIEVSLVIETFTYAEHPDLPVLRRALEAGARFQQERPEQREVWLADISGAPEVRHLLQEFPAIRRIDAAGLTYDRAKLLAAQQSRGEYLLFLDGDCAPVAAWFNLHLAALKNGESSATGGFTRYRGGFLAAVDSILDFGFLFPLERRVLACYASNNAGFRRSTFLADSVPDGVLRCNCYAHAQLLIRRGNGMLLLPEARVLHHRQPFFVERFRQGQDAVLACLVNPALRERSWIRAGILASPLFYIQAVVLDWLRMAAGYRDLDVPLWCLPAAMVLFPLFRVVDLVGMAVALQKLPADGKAVACDLADPSHLNPSS